MPQATLDINNKNNVEEFRLHKCITKFKKDELINVTFLPVDGEFELIRYYPKNVVLTNPFELMVLVEKIYINNTNSNDNSKKVNKYS